MRFAKLHGAGNDFILFDGSEDAALLQTLPPLVPALCHRRFGIGADGVLLLLPLAAARLRLVYWNSDGSEAAFCANGTRCAARFAAERWGWAEMTIDTGFATVAASVTAGAVTLTLPPPERVEAWQELTVGGEAFRCRYVVLGVPHLVVPVHWSDFWQRPLLPLAPALRAHPELPPGGANVNFAMGEAQGLALRSFERGVEGETLACGSGAVAAALVAAAEGWTPAPVSVRTASRRTLLVEPLKEPPRCPSRLTGPAEWVASGSVAEELLSSG